MTTVLCSGLLERPSSRAGGFAPVTSGRRNYAWLTDAVAITGQESNRLWAAYQRSRRDCVENRRRPCGRSTADTIHFHHLEVRNDAVLPAMQVDDLYEGQGHQATLPGGRLEESIPETLRKMLRSFQSRLVVAGGVCHGQGDHRLRQWR
jgi:hypothetical protein